MHKIAILGCLRERQIKIDCFMHILQSARGANYLVAWKTGKFQKFRFE